MSVHTTEAFDAATAEQVVTGCDLRGKLVVVTGPSAGIGLETVRVLAAVGADLVLGARDPEALRTSAPLAGASGSVLFDRLDLLNDESVDAFADTILALDRPVDILINNAGIMAAPLQRDRRGLESQFSTNFVGHAILTSRLAPALRRSHYARLVSLSSVGHHRSGVVLDDINFERRPYDPWLAYAQSKSACALLAVQAQSALGHGKFDAFAVHPGVIQATNLTRYMSEEQKAAAQARSTIPAAEYKSVGSGAATTAWAATASELTGKGPLYLEDCGIAKPIAEPNYRRGVCAFAMDPAIAQLLWNATEDMLGRKLPL